MKKIYIIAATLSIAVAASGCGLEIPVEESSYAAVSDVSVQTSDISNVESTPEESETADSSNEEESKPQIPEISDEEISRNESSDDSSAEESSEEPSEASQQSEESSVPEESSQPPEESSLPEESSQPVIENNIGSLFEPYYHIMKSRQYMLRTVESKLVGGEAMPYTTTVYRNGDTVYITIEESYGALSELLVKDGNTYWMDSYSKQAICSKGTESLDAEHVLFTDGIKYLRKDTIKWSDTDYTCEIYTDNRGLEFSFGFSMFGELRLYRYYDAKKKDTITIDIELSANISDGEFDVPDGYTIIGG